MPSHYDDIAAEDNFEMAEQWIAARNPEKAVEHLKKTIDLNPHFIFAYITLARTLSGMGRHDEAFHVMKRAEREDPEFDYLFFLAAKFAFRQGDLIAIIGKGHETYRDREGVKTPFLERELLEEYAQQIGLE